MSLIGDLINVLNDEEAEKLNNISVTGKEKDLLLILLNHRHKPEPTNECIIRQLKTTAANCDKLKSYLLQKSYNILVPEGGIKLLTFLSNKKFVTHLLYREFPKVEKEYIATNNKQELASFYRSVFHLVIGVTIKDYDAQLTESIGEKLLQVSDNKDDELYVEAKLLWIEINNAGITASLKNKVTESILRTKIERYENKATTYGGYEGKYQSNYLWQWFFALTDCVEKALFYCEKNVALFKVAGNNLPPNYQLNTEFKYAEMLYFADRFKQAFRQYTFLFFEKYPERLNTEIYHIAKFVQICIVTQNYNEGLKAINHYANVIKPSLDSSNVITILHLAKIYLAKGELEVAYNHILKARSIIKKSVYIQYEIELRNLENIYFYLRGDRKFAVALAKKNLKFLNSKELTINSKDYSYFFHLIIAIYKLQENSKALTRPQKVMFEFYQHGSYAQYGSFLKMILNNCDIGN
jgi:hypothetical protein